LSIVDLDPRSDQPMANEDASLWLVFNGEIYDFQELRGELAATGHQFRSAGDSEVLLHGYEAFGLERLLDRLNGMYAFAIWDARRRTLVMARDRLGKKPLYYGMFGGRFCFASDIKALQIAAGGTLTLDENAIARFLYWGYVPGPETIFRGVRQLMPGSFARITDTGIRESRYWRVSFARTRDMGERDAMDAVDAELDAAVRRRLYSDVPLGAFLSGGVDSSLVVHYMSEAMTQPVRTFSVGFDAAEHDERQYARAVADHCHTDHREEMVHADARAILPELVWEYGQPFGDAAAISTSY